MADEVLHDSSSLPDSVQGLFEGDSGGSDSGDSGGSDSGVSETERAGNEGSVASSPQDPNGGKDYNAVVRQRDAIIREKQQLANERRQLMAHINRLTEMWNQNVAPQQAQQQQAQPQKQEIPPPDPKIDPIGYLEHQRKAELSKVQDEIGKLQKAFEDKSREINSQNQANQIYQRVVSDEAQFRQAKPDYDNAVNHLDQKIREYFINDGATEDMAERGLHMFKQDVFTKAIQLGLPVAETFYHHALHFGWNGQQTTAKPSGNGVNPSPNIAASRRGSEAGSLSTAGHGSVEASGGGNRVTLDQFQRMSLGDPVKMLISSNKQLFKTLVETGEVHVA
jgi:hypothetical protein